MKQRNWIHHGVGAILDQGLFAGSNFLLNVLLARWLTKDNYGAFTVAYITFVLLSTLHTALVTEPMLVFSQGRFQDRRSDYYRVIRLLNRWSVLILGILIGLVALGLCLANQRRIGLLLLVMAALGPGVMGLWLTRRMCYAVFKIGYAVLAGLLNVLLIVAGIYLLKRLHWLSPATALGLLGVLGLIGSVLLFWALGVSAKGSRNAHLRREVVKAHWHYGRWAMGTNSMNGVSNFLYYLILPIGYGLAASAELRAMTNLIMPALLSLVAINALLVPILVEALPQPKAFKQAAIRAGVLLIIGSVIYAVVLILFARSLVHLVYGQAYLGSTHILWYLAVVPVVSAVISVFGAVLRAREQPNLVFLAYSAATVACLTVGLFATWRYGVTGAAVGMLVTFSVTALVMGLALARPQVFARQRGKSAPHVDRHDEEADCNVI